MQKVATACHLMVLAVGHGECQLGDGLRNVNLDNMNDSRDAMHVFILSLCS